MKITASLNNRLIISHLLVSLISIILISAFAGTAIFNAARKDTEHNLEDLAFAASNVLELPLQEFKAGNNDPQQVQEALMHLLADQPDLKYTIFLPDGTVLVNHDSELPQKADLANAPEVWEAMQGEIGEGENIRKDASGKQTYYVAVRVQREDEVLGILRLGAYLQPAMASARRSLALLVLVAALVTVGVGLFGWLLASNLTLPIQNLIQTADTLSRGDLSARVKPAGPEELHHLAEAFNIMAGRLQDHVNELRTFVANASHELRTPLTVVKLRAEALRDGAMNDPGVAEQFLAEIESEVDRLARMVNDMLDLSRMEAGLASNKRALVNLAAVATDVYETFTIRANRAGIHLSLEVEPNLSLVLGSEDQLRRVFYNFVDNAIKFTPRGGQVNLFLASGREGRTVRVLVKDTGPGIASADLPHIFERFYRVEATRPRFGSSKGSGLGLAIAKSIVENHRGKIGVNSQIGRGSTFWVELPTAE